MDFIFDEVFRALGYLFIAGIAYYAWKFSFEYARSGHWKGVLWKGFIWCAGIALFSALTLGNASCEIQYDPLYGGCEQYADDGYTPTGEQQVGNFAYVLTLLYVPVLVGALNGREKYRLQ